MKIAVELADDSDHDVMAAIEAANENLEETAFRSDGIVVAVGRPGGDWVFAWRMTSRIGVLEQ